VLAFGALRSLLLEEDLGPLVVARDLCEPHFAKLSPEASLGEAFRLLEGEGLEDLPVVDPANPGRLLGLLSRADLIAAYNRTVAALGALPASARPGPQWADSYRVLVVSAPRVWVGRSLRDIDCRARHGVAVLAVRPAGRVEPGYELPDPDRPFTADDTLVIAGTADGLRAAQVL